MGRWAGWSAGGGLRHLCLAESLRSNLDVDIQSLSPAKA